MSYKLINFIFFISFFNLFNDFISTGFRPNYKNLDEKNISFYEKKSEIKYSTAYLKKNFTKVLPENLTVYVGILANPEPIDEKSNEMKEKRQSIINGTNTNWINSTFQQDYILTEIRNYFNYDKSKNVSINVEFVSLNYWQNDSIVDEILSRINGVLYTGGNRHVDFRYSWEKFMIKLMQKIMNLQKNGRKIPLWGICQGIEVFHAVLVNTTDVFENYDAWDVMLPIEFVKEDLLKEKESSVYRYLSEKEKDFLVNEKSTTHYHRLGINPIAFNEKRFSILSKYFQITSFAYDKNGKKCVDSIYSFKPYNIYAVQYHPEKKPIGNVKHLRQPNQDFLEKYNKVMKKIAINYVIDIVEDKLDVKMKLDRNLQKNYEISDRDEYLEKIKITEKDIVYNFHGGPIPVYIFSE